ncbi:hypothetical protein [Paenibacillus odorifer]|uniref:hypothetical protein n=1 Tax=Paenibacillus odorifer TaxID=189426 RepID=UPI00096D6B58|nr:hypothetical protein [Paenibacillus odorifer]OMD10707.1 hypothetical protein BJP50_27990 [Paenibacillus odorifer]OME41400.1 hypothetical protein BSK58_14800 [Paenibacillus odorifer]
MFKNKPDDMKFNNELLAHMTNKYVEELEKAAFERRFIYTGKMKRTGKTTALIMFAKKHNYNVILGNFSPVKKLREKFEYEKIYSDQYYGKLSEIAVVDNDASYAFKIEHSLPIITGFTEIDLSLAIDKKKPDWWIEGDATKGLVGTHLKI